MPVCGDACWLVVMRRKEATIVNGGRWRGGNICTLEYHREPEVDCSPDLPCRGNEVVRLGNRTRSARSQPQKTGCADIVGTKWESRMARKAGVPLGVPEGTCRGGCRLEYYKRVQDSRLAQRAHSFAVLGILSTLAQERGGVVTS